MMKLSTFAALAMFSGCVPGQKYGPAIQDALVIASDIAQIISALEALSVAHFAQHHDPAKEVEVAEAFALAHLEANSAQRLGASKESAKDIHARLVAVLKKNGVPTSLGKLGVPGPL